MNRRGALRALGCACCAVVSPPLWAQSSDVCTSIDPPLTPGYDIADYAAEEDQPEDVARQRIESYRIADYGTAFLEHRWRRGDGMPGNGHIVLGVHFLNGSTDERATVRELANEWIRGPLVGRIEFKFDVSPTQSQIRVMFNGGQGNNSLVGRTNLLRPRHLPTMHLAQLSRRVILHEFGHALGLMHEHHNPNAEIEWQRDVVIRELQESQGWDVRTIELNVLGRYGPSASCVGDPSFNNSSIMLYQIPSRWTVNGFQSQLNDRISERDYRCLAGLYGDRT